MKLLYDYGVQIHDHKIDRIKSLGVFAMIHILCKKSNIKHIIGVDQWSYEQGHCIASKIIQDKIKNNKWEF